MGFLRREEPLHEKLAREGGLDFPRDVTEPSGAMSPEHPFWQVAGIHGVPRPREWDAVVSAESPGLPGDDLDFVVLADGTLIVEEELPEDALGPLAEALETSLAPPYHAYARRRDGDVWSAAAMQVDVVEVPEQIAADEVALVVQGEERTLLLDDERSNAEIPTLEAFGSARFDAFVLHASRLDDVLWEVTVNAL